MKRLFVAIRIVPQIRLVQLIAKLKERLEGENIKWVDDENLHLTINFLGETHESMLDGICSSLEKVCKNFGPITFQLKGLGIFGLKKSPRVIYVKIVGGEELKALGQSVNTSFTGLKIQERLKPINPHLTLGRIRTVKNKLSFIELAGGNEDVVLQDVKVPELILYESILKPQGPVYIPLQKFELKFISHSL